MTHSIFVNEYSDERPDEKGKAKTGLATVSDLDMGTEVVTASQVYASSQNWPVTEGRQYEKFSKHLECADESRLRLLKNEKTDMKPYSAVRI